MADMEFTSFAALGIFVERMNKNAAEAVGDATEQAAVDVLFIAREKFGTYQEAEGPFPAWDPLTPETLYRRQLRGINPNNEPLYESGDLKESYEVMRTGATEVVIGSDLAYAGVQETGDAFIPPRPVIGPSILEYEKLGKLDKARDIFVDVLLNGRRFRDLNVSKAAMDSTITPGYGGGKTFEANEYDG